MIPAPQSYTKREGAFEFRRPLVLSGPPQFTQLLELLAAELKGVGIDACLEADPAVQDQVQDVAARSRIELVLDAGIGKAEGYRLHIERHTIVASASEFSGLFYATRTLLVAAAGDGQLQLGEMLDAPRYSWRGAHLDVARHFYPVEEVKRFIDLIALHKMNVFHWHLTEDQGWRIEIDAFPELTRVAAFRKGKDAPYGGYYSKSEVREVVEYARQRAVTVVPEIEMPGHAVAALAGYPELSCSGGPFEVETRWGIFDDVYCAGNDQTFEFLKKVLDEVVELFPCEFFHIGGDECPKTRWKTCPKCQARIAAEGLKNEDELQSWFIRDIARYLEQKGKRLVGWDEILEGGLAPGATVMSWRGTEGGIKAAEMGHDVIMSPTSHCYLDYKQAKDEGEPGAWFAPALDLPTVYAYEPTPSQLSAEQARHILGVQANVWTERMPTFKQVEYMTFPRLCALAEVAWTEQRGSYEDFAARLEKLQTLLDAWQVGYRGSRHAVIEEPTAEEKQQYLRAMKEREAKGQSVAAY